MDNSKQNDDFRFFIRQGWRMPKTILIMVGILAVISFPIVWTFFLTPDGWGIPEWDEVRNQGWVDIYAVTSMISGGFLFYWLCFAPLKK